jgi:hypothetical protein
MSEEHAVPESPELKALHQRLAENSLGGHWQSREKLAKLRPWVWPWSAIYSCLMESGEVVRLEAASTMRPAKNRPIGESRHHESQGHQPDDPDVDSTREARRAGGMPSPYRRRAAIRRRGRRTGYTNVEGEEADGAGDLCLTELDLATILIREKQYRLVGCAGFTFKQLSGYFVS